MSKAFAPRIVPIVVSEVEEADVTVGWAAKLAELTENWQATVAEEARLASTLVEGWLERLEDLRERQSVLVERGDWRGGPRTLLAAIGVHHRELPLTAGLAWLLRPDGHHGLGAGMLARLLHELGVAGVGATGAVRVVREETRELTRADLVVYGDDWTVVVEAKTHALEQNEQLDRLHRLWQDEASPVFAFLTRGSRLPVTAVASIASWRNLSWARVAELANGALAASVHPAPGVHDYIDTLEAYHSD
jgi:hypothetical protein